MRTQYQVEGDIVEITYPDGEVRRYRTVGTDGGYVYDITTRPGTLGQQVLDPRAPAGTTLTGPADGEALSDLLRQCLRAARGQATRRGWQDPQGVKL